MGEQVALYPPLIEDLSRFYKNRDRSPIHPDRPIDHKITEENIIDITQATIVDASGKEIAISFIYDGTPRGLSGENLYKFQKFTNKISEHNSIKNHISEKSIRKISQDYIRELYLKKNKTEFGEIIEKYFSENVQKQKIFIPVKGLRIDGELKFGSSTITTFSNSIMSNFEELVHKLPNADRNHGFLQKLRKNFLGRSVLIFHLEAEEIRAFEIAEERSERYLSLLHYWSAPILIFNITSHVAPADLRPWPSLLRLAFSKDSAQMNDSLIPPMWEMDLSFEIISHYEKFGLHVLSILSDKQENSFQEHLMRSILFYGRSAYHIDPSDKLLQITTAFEMLALKNSTEPIGSLGADRLAFAISNDPKIRQDIVKNFKRVYGLRSRRTHHGHDIKHEEEISKYMHNIWQFMFYSLRHWDKYTSHDEFIDNLENMRYGH
ncbi:HEPN domain-containing protein [Nisaea sp.]|uniref:HEPN domain-containing protein n=1 Tax=Nisaea sp. TaxID=2024842 RepID=UPI0025F07A70|nr:HEPN domain-containing protein [Nisaea sp.]